MQGIIPQIEKDNPNYSHAVKWFSLAIGSLVLAGLFSLFLIIARTPLFSDFITDPLFFKRGLVVHVDLALIVWVFSFIASLFYVLIPGERENGFFNKLYFGISVCGVGMMAISPGVTGSEPILSNYIPVVDNSVFIAGLLMFSAGIFFSFLDSRLMYEQKNINKDFSDMSYLPGIKIAVLLIFIAFQTFVISYVNIDTSLRTDVYYEILFWGGGHILQFASEIIKVSIWIFLLYSLTGSYPIARKHFFILSGLYILPVLAFLPYSYTHNPATNDFRDIYTNLMRWGIFPFTTVVFIYCVKFIIKNKENYKLKLQDFRYNGFIISVLLTVLGYLLGALISSSDTMVPAHYHASIGAVTVAFMTFSFLLIKMLNFSLPHFYNSKIVSYQPFIFGFGQALFSIGFAIAGSQGMGRKVYGSEQKVKGLVDYAGLTMMGLGGFIAIIGGLIFLSVILAAMYKTFFSMHSAVKIINN
ncbi:MAG: cbb3-type cytochrome c oxidase subunit I [Spirochaetia bacterium]|nr:cbb3-type cytochrome c oxidase subunit I [Spirochaetia bacterium]